MIGNVASRGYLWQHCQFCQVLIIFSGQEIQFTKTPLITHTDNKEENMKLKLETAEIFVPDGFPAEEALKRTTHMAISAHQDDIEIMAYDGVLKCFQQKDSWFTAVIDTNGSGSPRDDLYKNYTDAEMQVIRRKKQNKAALIGE